MSVRSFLFAACLLWTATLTAVAAPIDGIRIESPQCKVVVYIDGRPVCLPTHSCFVANLRGSCRVEVYAAPLSGDKPSRDRLLYDERIHCRMDKVEEILIDGDRRPGSHWDHSSSRPSRPDVHRPEGRPDLPMSSSDFNRLLATLKKQPFESDRQALLDQTLLAAGFTTDQCLRLLDLYHFDSEKKPLLKKLYPCVTDKGNFYRAIDCLTFASDKEEIRKFVEQYHRKRR